MIDIEEMNGAEIAVTRCGLGLNRPQLARLISVTDRSIQQSETERYIASRGVRSEIAHLETVAASTVDRIAAALEHQDAPVLAIPRDPDPGSPLPPPWHQAIAARVRLRIPGLRVVYRDPAAQTDPELTDHEVLELREALDANLLVEQIAPDNLDLALQLLADQTGDLLYPVLLARVRTWSPEQRAAALELARAVTPAPAPAQPPAESAKQALEETVEETAGEEAAAQLEHDEDPAATPELSDTMTMYEALLYDLEHAPDLAELNRTGGEVTSIRETWPMTDEQIASLKEAFRARSRALRAAQAEPSSTPSAPADGTETAEADESETADGRPSAVGVDLVDGALTASPLPIEIQTRSLVQVMGWAAGLNLGARRAGHTRRRHDGIVYLSDAVAAHLKLPKTAPKEGRIITALTEAGWSLGAAGLSDGYATFYRGEPGTPEHVSLRLVILPYLRKARPHAPEFDLMGADEDDGTPPAARLARRQNRFQRLTETPMLYTAATTGLSLLRARRPPQVPDTDADGKFQFGDDGKMLMRQNPHSVEAGGTAMPYPVLHSAHPDSPMALRRPQDIAQEEDYNWRRGGDRYQIALTEQERGHACAVALDTVTSFASVLERLVVPEGSYTRVDSVPAAQAGRTVHGFGYADLSGIDVEPELPHFATPDGQRPAGPQPYAFNTLKYARDQYRWEGPITDCWVSDRHAALFEPWWGPLRDVFVELMAQCGVGTELTGQEFIDAYAAYRQVGSPDTLALIDMNKSLYKSTVGKLREGPADVKDSGAFEAALERWLKKIETDPWQRSDIRAYVLSAARTMGHYRIRKTFKATGRAPIAVLLDCALYTTAAPSPLEITDQLVGPDGKPIPGTIRLGVRPGSKKFEGWAPLPDLLERVALTGRNPAALATQYEDGVYNEKRSAADAE